MAPKARLRIGELSRRVGVSPELLRAWETRYGLVRPERTAGGLRLYSDADERRVREMCGYTAAGVPASEAARLAKLEHGAGQAVTASAEIAEFEVQLERAARTLDESLAQAALDRLFLGAELQVALVEGILPFLYRLGELWKGAEVSVAQEHFVSNVIGARLRTLTRGWGSGVGPRAVLACPPGERHELGLLCFGLLLRERGWQITYLGADTPLQDIASSLEQLTPTIVVLCATSPEPLGDARREIAALRRSTRVAVGGAGATATFAEELELEFLGEDPATEAAALRP